MTLPNSASAAATLPNLEAFVASAEALSFSEAARKLRVTPQAVSRAVARLEGTLDVQLFRRSTRVLQLTVDGAQYFKAAQDALRALAAAQSALRETKAQPAGVVRISAAIAYGHSKLLPSLAAFQRAHPLIEVQVHLSNQNTDFVREGTDLAIRMGSSNDASLVSVKLGKFALGVFASPAYLRMHGTPQTPAVLDAHRCIVFGMPKTGKTLPWSLRAAEHSPLREYVPSAVLRIEDDVMGMRTLAVAGAGLMQFYHFAVEQELRRGELVEVLEAFGGHSRPFSLLYPRNQPPSRAARALLEHLKRVRQLDLLG